MYDRLNGVYRQNDTAFFVDVTGEYPVILMEIDPATGSIQKSYLNAHGQTLIQYDGTMAAGDKYFYLHDRLGSVRTVIDAAGNVQNVYTYDPFGNHLEQNETIDNRFRFAGYKYDPVTGNYNCNARWYDPRLYRFTGRDPITGSLTLHAYLYCMNDPVNNIDPSGKFALLDLLSGMADRGAAEGTSAPVYCRALWSVRNIVRAMNLRAVWMDFQLIGKDAFAAAQGLAKVGTAFANVARAEGVKALVALGVTLGGWERLDPGGPVDFGKAILGDPNPPQTVSGVTGLAIHNLMEDLWKDIAE